MAINSGDRVDSALKDMALVMKQLDRSDEAIEAIRSFRHLCSTEAQESLDNILIELYKVFEPLEYKYDICEAILLWEQYRNMTTVLTREYLDVRPDGWLDYAAKRIAQLGADKCYNKTLCEEHLNLILPGKPPFYPRQFQRCAVVGNSGDLLKTEFGEEIDRHDLVIRDNEAPVNEKYAKYVGLKRDFRLVVRGAARNMVKILQGAPDEVLIIKSVTHKDFNAMIKSITNPVYLFQGIVLRRGAKGTGMKSIELALSMCDIVDIYGFTVDPGYTECQIVDPSQKGQELDADQLVDLSFTFKFADLQKNKPRKQPLWHIVKCPQQHNLVDSGYYVLKFIKEIIRRNSVSVPKIWYGKKDSFSENEIDEVRKEWIEYLLELMF